MGEDMKPERSAGVDLKGSIPSRQVQGHYIKRVGGKHYVK
ncbi:hypothetical protein HMPREF9970_2263 [Lachnoanaerobaculum saburreum F0468]|uniref:Uncharacterized protein n=1 Tax=Lachnoanaerobaculum saburreum F0468 TaxID=1095750 RepID=I0R7Q4_9FIRM|nr:hypothetical protein HMPREF9970_2263 [Lachnoanaerobaculum saburreum F0468]